MKIHFKRSIITPISFVTLASAPLTTLAQNTSTSTGFWHSVFTGTPDRQDGVTTTDVSGTLSTNDTTTATTDIGVGFQTSSAGQTVEVTGGHTVTVDGTITGIAASANTNGQSTGVGGVGYAETSSALNVGSSTGVGTITMSGGRLDVGMSNGGVFLQGDGDANAGTIDTTIGALSVDGNYRNVSHFNSVNSTTDSDSNDPFRQFYLGADVYDTINGDAASSAASSVTGQTADLFPLYGAGGSLNIGSTDDGTFNMDGGELNVVQYGWGWSTDGGSSVPWDANGKNNDYGSATTGRRDGGVATDATFNAANNRFEGFRVDYNTGGYTTNGTDADRNQTSSGDNQVLAVPL